MRLRPRAQTCPPSSTAPDASEWAAPYLEWAADKGLVEGYDEPRGKRLAPGENASRERAATVLMRAFDKGVLK